MNNVFSIIAFIAMLTFPLLSSCNFSEDMENTMDNTNAIEPGNSVLGLLVSGEYRFDGVANWSEIRNESDCICPLLYPSRYIFLNGRLWRDRVVVNPYEYECESGHVVERVLYAYREHTGFDREIFVASRIRFDNRIDRTVLPWRDSSIGLPEKGYIRLSIPDTEHGGILEMDYRLTDKAIDEIESNLFFDTRLDAELAIIEMAREVFGDEFDLNEYTKKEIVYENSKINLNELERQVRKEFGDAQQKYSDF